MAHRTPEELEDEHQLILEAQRDRAAFAALYERYVDQIHAYILNLTKSRESADDVTAATFAKALEGLPKFQWRGVPYSAWLYRVASNELARSKRRPAWAALGDDVPDASRDLADLAAEWDRADQLRAAIAELPPDQQRVLLLRFGSDLANRDIAGLMDRSEGAVKLLTFRALTALRHRLGAPLPSERAARGAPR
jgi:RNA polymerase sigma-70 factor (ECF subfamily)